MIPVTVVILAKNEEAAIARCVAAARSFADIVVVDSHSTDDTRARAERAGARIVPFRWNGAYPKKKEWCLTNTGARFDWLLMLDADEVLTPKLVREIAGLMRGSPRARGYFVRGRPVWHGRRLRFGTPNRKLALFDRRYARFPRPDDLAVTADWPVEMHYQPVIDGPVAGLRHALDHHIDRPLPGLEDRHRFYARWEAHVRATGDRARLDGGDRPGRRALKAVFRRLPLRAGIVLMLDLVIRLGVLDGRAGWQRAWLRARYYHWIDRLSRAPDGSTGS